MMLIPEEPTVKDFYKTAAGILREHNQGHLVPVMDNIDFILTKLDDLERLYFRRFLDFTQIKWVQEYYRS